MTQLELNQVQVVGLAAPSSIGLIHGLGVICASEEDALAFADHLKQYVISPGPQPRTAEVRFTSEVNGKVGCAIAIRYDQADLAISIEDVDSATLDHLLQGLSRSKYYFVLAGWADEASGHSSFVDPELGHLFKRDIYVDGDQVLGSGSWPDEPFLASAFR